MTAVLVLLGSVFAVSAAAQTKPSLAETSAATAVLAERYFEAYIARQWATLAPLLAEGATFVDPTAEPVFGLVQSVGKAAIMQRFEEGYAAIQSMHFKALRTVFSGSHAVFEGTLDWSLRLSDGRVAVTQDMPFLTILRLDGGRVVEHRDYADYQPFLKAMRQAKPGG